MLKNTGMIFVEIELLQEIGLHKNPLLPRAMSAAY